MSLQDFISIGLLQTQTLSWKLQ